MKNFLLKRLIRYLHPFIPLHSEKKTPQRILVVATTALGDTLWATPGLENLRKSFPEAFLAVLTSPIGMEILQNNPWTNELIPLKEPMSTSFFSEWRKLYKKKFDTILIFHASQRLILPLCSLLGASRLIGTSGINKGLDALLTDPLPNEKQHEIVRRLKMVQHIGGTASNQTLSFFLRPEERLPARMKGPWIAIHPGSKDVFKRWTPENFIAVGKRLKELFSCQILITGNPSELPLMKSIAAQIPNAQLYEANTALRPFAALLEQMDLLICNDTGPVHLACALKRPVIALYSATDPHFCGPHLAKNAIAIYKSPSCDPCLKRKCTVPFCLLQIGPEEVVQAAAKLLQRINN